MFVTDSVIELNQYYYFVSDKDQEDFLEEAKERFGIPYDESTLLAFKPVALLAVKIGEGHHREKDKPYVAYLTKRSSASKYGIIPILYERGNDKVTAKEIDMNNEVDKTALVRDWYDKMSAQINRDKNKWREEFLLNSIAGKAVSNLLKVLSETCPNYEFDIFDILEVGMLSKVSRKELDDGMNKFSETSSKLEDTFRECSNLVTQADTFEQRMWLLVKYGIIKEEV